MSTKTAVTAEHDAGLWPEAANELDQQCQDGPTVSGAIDVARAQIAHQQMATTEHIERQEAVMVVIAMKEAPFLIAMHRHIGRIEVEHDLSRRLIMLGDEVLPQQAMGLHHRFAIGLLFQAPQSGFAGQRLQAVNRSLQRVVMAQAVMIVEILVAGGQCIDALGEQCLQSMLDTPRITPIWNDFGQAAGQAMLPVDLAQQQQARIRGDVTTGERGLDEAAREG